MSETSDEQERFLDFFDNVIVFSYAYEWQKRSNNSIDELVRLRDCIDTEIQNNELLNAILSAEKKRDAVYSVLHGLQKHVKNNIRPEIIRSRGDWHGYPENISGFKLYLEQQMYVGFVDDLMAMVDLNLNQVLIDEFKPFVTVEQVQVMLDKIL